MHHSNTVETTTNLAASGTFNGLSHEVGGSPSAHKLFNAVFSSSHASGTNGAKVQASADGSTWYDVAVATLAAGVPQTLSAPVCAKFMRAQLVNGATLTTSLFVATQRSRS